MNTITGSGAYEHFALNWKPIQLSCFIMLIAVKGLSIFPQDPKCANYDEVVEL